MQMNLLLMQLCAIAFALVVQGSAEEGRSALVHQGKSLISNGPSPASQANGSFLHPPLVLPPLKSAPVPQSTKGLVPSLSPSTPTRLPPYSLAPPSLSVQGTAPSVPPGASQKKALHNRAPVLVPVAPVPVVSPSKNFPQNSPTVHPIMPGSQPPVGSPSKNFPQNSPTVHPIMPGSLPPVASSSKKLPQNSPTAHPIMPGSLSPSAHQKKAPENEDPLSVPVTPAPVALPLRKLRRSPSSVQPVMPGVLPPIFPVASPSKKLPQNSPTVHPIMPPSAHQGKAPENEAPISVPVAPAPVALPPRKLRRSPLSTKPIMPGLSPPMLPVPVASPPSKSPVKSPSIHPIPREPPSTLPDPNASPMSTPPPSINSRRDGMPVAAPPNGTPNSLSPVNHHPSRGSFPVVAPSTHKAMKHSDGASAPAPSLVYRKSPHHKRFHSPVSSPLASFYKHHHARNNITSLAPASSYLVPPPSKQGPIIPPAPLYPPKFLPKSRRRHNAPPPLNPGSSVSPSHSPFPSSASHASPAPSPSPTAPSDYTESVPILAPKISPSGSSPRNPKTPLRQPVLALPPPPPNKDCTSIVCTEPLTNTPPGSPCGCVFPMQVGLRLSVSLYTFFPLVSSLAEEIAAGVFIKQSQVRIIGANAASQQPEKTIVLIDLVPLGEKFDNTTAFLIFQRFWLKQVAIEASFFGDYEVLYVRYPGLPPSPPMAPSSIIVDDGSYSGHDNNGRRIHPLGVNVRGMRHKEGLSGSVIAIIALSASIAVVLCSACAWVLLLKRRDRVCQPTPTPQALLPTLSRPSGITGSMLGSGPTSASLSFGSSIATYTGSAKTFSSSEIEKATDNFDASRVLGEGGFGRVYSGVLEDGTQVAVKVLKRDDQQGGREFLAEVEMLSRLHHRNLVKLIGICTEERTRCLVYELIPNGSVESHLHGVDKKTSPLDWGTRLKVALGAARGLAYLHEDSSPGVIHRDFKSSNILLEHDFTPKVSDFGLARTALDGENRHISTRVMGTFGYVAPEYAMTGHLLVKSDVYSYGVVLLELLSGRKPVDMSQPPGQENLVAWARPLLTSKEGLETIIDPSLGSDFPFDSVAKVAAIASMCVQPEVTHRPFMGEVVQALKLVCNECDETKEAGSRRGSISFSQGDFSNDLDARISAGSGLLPDTSQTQFPVPNYDSDLDTETRLSMSDLFSTSVRLGRQASGSFRRHASSSPLRTGRGRQFRQRMRRLSGGSVSEHAITSRMWPGSH